MEKRADLRKFYQSKDEEVLRNKQYQERTAQLNALEETVISAFNALIRFMDGKTTKTEVVNQLKSISTPDVDKVVQAVSKLDADVLSNKLDLKPVLEALNGLKREFTLLPDKMTKVNNFSFDTSVLEQAIKDLKLNPKIEVKSPEVNVAAPNLTPLKKVMLDVLEAIKTQEYPEAPITDLSTLEKESAKHSKQLEEANKHLKKIVDKPVGGGGGGGGNGTPYQNTEGKASYVALTTSGGIPVADTAQAQKITVVSSITYIAAAAPGTAQSSALWQVKKIDESVAGTTVITWADGNGLFDNVATDLTLLSYS